MLSPNRLADGSLRAHKPLEAPSIVRQHLGGEVHKVGAKRDDFTYHPEPQLIVFIKKCAETDHWETMHMRYDGSSLMLYGHAVTHDRKENVTAVMFVFILTE